MFFVQLFSSPFRSKSRSKQNAKDKTFSKLFAKFARFDNAEKEQIRFFQLFFVHNSFFKNNQILAISITKLPLGT